MFNCSSEIESPNRKVISYLLKQGRCMMYEGTCFCGTGLRDGGKCLTFRRNFFVSQVLPASIKSELWLAVWLAKLIWLANSVIITADRDPRACDKHAAIIITHCNPTAAQTPAAAQGNTMSVRRHIRGVSELTIVTEDTQSWGCGLIYPDDTASTITNRHEKKNYNNPLSARCSSVRCAGSSIQFSSNYACLLSPFADSCTRPSPRSVSAVRAALPGLFLVCMLPIPF